MAKTGIHFQGLFVSTAKPQSSLMSIRLPLPSLLSSFLNQLYLPGFTLQFSSGCQVLKAFTGLTCVAHSSVKSLSTNSEHDVWCLGEAGEKLERQQSSQILIFNPCSFLIIITILKSFFGFPKNYFQTFCCSHLLASLVNLGSLSFNRKIDSAICVNTGMFSQLRTILPYICLVLVT